MRKNKNLSKKNKSNYITKLFFRIFLSSLILLFLVTISPKELKNKIKEDVSFLKFVKTFNSLFGEIIIFENDELVDSTIFYDYIEYKNEMNYIKNDSFDGVYNFSNGIVTKIIKNDNETYTISIITEDDYLFTYYDLSSFDYRLYEYVNKGEIIGKTRDQNNSYNYKIKITKDGKNYDYFEIS